MKPKIPKHLKADGRRFFKKVLSEVELTDAHDLERLSLACESLDKISEARQRIEAEGAFFIDRWLQPKEHPAAKSIRDNTVLFARLIRELCLDIETPKENRLPGRY